MLEYLLSALNDAVLAYDMADKQYLFISPAVEQVLGYTADDFMSKPGLWFSIIHPADKDHITEAVRRLSLPGEQEFTYRIVTSGNQTKWIQDKHVTFIHKDTKQQVFLNIIKDVDEIVHYRNDTEEKVWFLNSLVNAQSTLICRTNADGYFTYISDNYAHLLGYEARELIGKSIKDITPAEDLPAVRDVIKQCFAHPGQAIHLQHHKIDKNGKVYSIESDFICVADRDGQTVELQGTGLDMTERINAQKQTQELLDKISFYLNSITDAFIILNKNWEFIRVNKAFEKLSRKSKEELVGHNMWQLFPLLSGTDFEYACFKARLEGISLTVTENFGRIEPIWLRITLYPSDEGLTIFVKDITSEKKVFEEIAWTKQNLEALMNNTRDLIWSVDTHKQYIFANNAYKSWLTSNRTNGYAAEPVTGEQGETTAYPDSQIKDWDNYYNKALGGKQFLTKRKYTDINTGQVVQYEIFFNPIRNDAGEVTGVGCFARNVTRRLRVAQSLLEQNMRLRKIASLSSHELRRPVATLMGLISILDTENMSNPENIQIITHIDDISKELDEVIRLIVNNTFLGE